MIREYISKILEIIFPSKCLICHRSKQDEELMVCSNCHKVLQRYVINCSVYDEYKHEFGRGILRYDGVIRFLMHKYKFEKHKEISDLFVDLIYDNVKDFCNKHHANYIIPIPLHEERLMQRGFNQSEVVARKLSKMLNITCRTDILLKAKNTVPQSTLSSQMKKVNLIDSFKIDNEFDLKGKDVILFDDIYTTGSTIEECAKMLYAHNTRKVYFLSISISNTNFKGENKK